ncbi:uncharacterized protein [Cherax quadricarinatus]
MGNSCRKGEHRSSIDSDDVTHIKGTLSEVVDAGESNSLVVQWENRQKELNVLVMEKLREDFHNRPDNFLLNLLVVSLQFYKNFGKEKADISNHIRDRELALDRKLSPSKKKIIYLGGCEEISGRHVLYQPSNEQYMELPAPLQIYVVQDNVEVYSEDQYEELQKRDYADVDGPAYRFCSEASQRHKGYVRLRCADIIPGMSRHNTYEDIYSFMKPTDESMPDPIVDLRPLRRNSQAVTLKEGDCLDSFAHKDSMLSDFEDSDSDEPASPPSSTKLYARRPSGVLPEHYPTGKLKDKINKLKEGRDEYVQNGYPGARTGSPILSRKNNLTERRPSGVFPKVGPEMERLRLSSTQRQMMNTSEGMAEVIRKLARVEEDSEDEEEREMEAEKEKTEKEEREQENNNIELHDSQYTTSEINKEKEKSKEVRLDASLNEDCFLNRKIKIKNPKDVYGLSTTSERRTYFSSQRHLECFEDEFETLAQILGKEHLVERAQMQPPAIIANELIIEQIGPKFNTEFIPTLILKEWPGCAFQWKLRERKQLADPETKIVYKWPREVHIMEAIQMGCNLVPLGHYNPVEPSNVMKIEWQIQFSRAEQILLRSLGHTQIRLMLLVEYLMRDHLEDIQGLKIQHLRYILFWMCEDNFKDWQEEKLGSKLKAYLKNLYNRLSTENLPHYFIDSCNMMETIPKRYMRQIQARVSNMKDNLPIYLMHTMWRMRTEEDYYPKLDILELYKLVTMKSYGIEQLNPMLLTLTGGEAITNQEKKKLDDGEDVLYSDSEEEYEHRMAKEKLHALRKERKRAATKGSEGPKRRHSTIRLDKKVKSVKDLRAGPLLSMFAKHFLAMARASNKYRVYPQGYMYLLLSGNMATLLEETGSYDKANKYRKEIEEINIAARGGIQDMLTSSSNKNSTYDLLSCTPSIRGSNWELQTSNWEAQKEQPLPKPPSDTPPVYGLNSVRPLTKLKNTQFNITFGDKTSEVLKTLTSESNSIKPDGSKDSPTVQKTIFADKSEVLKTLTSESDSIKTNESKDSPTVQQNGTIFIFSGGEEESTDF